MQSALLTNASAPKSVVVTQSLGRKGIGITTSDCDHLSPGFFSKYSLSHFIYPDPIKSEAEFVNTIQNNLKRRKIDVLMPINSIETLIISRNKDRFTPYTKVPFEDFDKMMQLHDKNEMMKIASALDITVPKAFNINDISDLHTISKKIEYPAVIKLRSSTSSVGLSYAHSSEELILKYKKTIKKFNLISSNYPIIQEYIPGDGYGVSLLYNHGDIRARFTHQRLREYPITGGPSTLRVSVRHAEMEKMAKRLLDYVSWHGVAMVEFKLDERNNKPVLLEVNPRFWGSVYQAIASGVDFPYLLYEMAVNGDVKTVFNYKLGVKTRFWIKDFLALSSSFMKSKDRFPILKELLKFYEKDLYYDTISTDDFLPGIMLSYQAIKELLKIGKL